MSGLSWLNTLRRFHKGSTKVLAMNQRNLDFIYPSNARKDFPIADDKLLTKQLFIPEGVPVPETYQSYSSFYEVRQLEADLSQYNEFVIKPAQGSGGGGIIVISEKTDDGWLSISGRKFTVQDMRRHIADIIFGVYSFGLGDSAIIEARINQHHALNALSPLGLTDVRIILYRHKPVLAMLRVPTKDSDGKANLHQGALGIGIDLTTGQGTHATHFGEPIRSHPDTGIGLIGLSLPFWNDILKTSDKAAKCVPLKYLGVDLAITGDGPVVLEINVRPGIEIQNANMQGMRTHLERIKTNTDHDAVGIL